MYRSGGTMTAPLQSFIDGTMHVVVGEYFYIISGCPVFDVALWPNHDGGKKIAARPPFSLLHIMEMAFLACRVHITSIGVVVGGKKWTSWLRCFFTLF